MFHNAATRRANKELEALLGVPDFLVRPPQLPLTRQTYFLHNPVDYVMEVIGQPQTRLIDLLSLESSLRYMLQVLRSRFLHGREVLVQLCDKFDRFIFCADTQFDDGHDVEADVDGHVKPLMDAFVVDLGPTTMEKFRMCDASKTLIMKLLYEYIDAIWRINSAALPRIPPP
ncbi:hypothetical protein FXO37_28109 [Capsicum annuum]|nr:hypothetical protein FXO37_28109 [Capsicum annuum]